MNHCQSITNCLDDINSIVSCLSTLKKMIEDTNILAPGKTNMVYEVIVVYVHVGWIYVSREDAINISKLSSREYKAEINISLIVDKDLRWKVLVGRREVEVLLEPLAQIPSLLSSLAVLKQIVSILDESVVCVGNQDDKYSSLLSSRKGYFHDISGELHHIYMYITSL